MNNYEKSKLLKDRHIKINIEWGGTEHFTHVSDMSFEGVAEFIRIMNLDNEVMMQSLLTALIQNEYEED